MASGIQRCGWGEKMTATGDLLIAGQETGILGLVKQTEERVPQMSFYDLI